MVGITTFAQALKPNGIVQPITQSLYHMEAVGIEPTSVPCKGTSFPLAYAPVKNS